MNELRLAIDEDNLQEFTRWLQREPDLSTNRKLPSR